MNVYYIDNISEFDGSNIEREYSQQELIDLLSGKAKLLYTSCEEWLKNNQTGLEMNLTTGETDEEWSERVDAEHIEQCRQENLAQGLIEGVDFD